MLDFFLQNSIRSALKKQTKRQKVFLNFKAIKNVLILFDYDNWFGVKPIVDDLIKNNKIVYLWTIGHADSLNPYIKQDLALYHIRIINIKTDLRWTRTLHPEVINEFKSLEYDTFLDLSFEDKPLMLYLKAMNRSRFSIGLQETSEKLYNFILLKEDDKSLFETYEQIKFYLATNA